VFHARGRPEQMSVSYLPLELVRGTPVADPANEPWPGGSIAQLASLGVVVRRVEESFRARMPTPEETRKLRIPPGVPVLTISRRMLAGENQDCPVEAAVEIVLPGDRVALDYTIDLD
jgi:GntR family transcriptional regulator